MKLFTFLIAIMLFIPVTISSQGKAYQTESWFCTGGPLGGLGYDIRYNFADHNLWYVTDAFGGIFISRDRGVSWTPSNNGITTEKGPDAVPVFCATVDPHDPAIIWIGTEGVGDVYRSIDSGKTWELRRNGIDPNMQSLTFRGFTVDPRSSDIVYSMAEIGPPGWTPDGGDRTGLEMSLTMGIVFKTVDAGKNWVEIWRGNDLARYCWINPHNPDILYVSTGIFDRESANTDVEKGIAGGVGIIKSTDGGNTWRELNENNGLADLYLGSLYMHPRHPDTLLAAAGQQNWSNYDNRNTGGVYMTKDGGENWNRVLGGETINNEIFFVVEYSELNPDIAYAFSGHGVYRSDDAGFTWQRFPATGNSWGPPGIVAGMPIDAQCDPENPMRVIVNNYLGGNLLSEDGGETWTSASKGYTGETVNHLTVAPGLPARIYEGGRSGIFTSSNGGINWEGLCYTPEEMGAKFNEIMGVAVDPQDPNHVLCIPWDNPTRVLYSYDGGLHWEIGSDMGNISFDPTISFAPSESSIAYIANDIGFMRSDDSGKNFNKVNKDTLGEKITAFAVHPENPDLIFAVSMKGLFLKSINGGENWTIVNNSLPKSLAGDLVVHPLNPNLMYTGFYDYSIIGGFGLYRSTDGGQNWTLQTAGLEPNGSITTVALDPTDVNIAYCGDSNSGVYYTLDKGETWHLINEGLTHIVVNCLAISDDGSVLYAGINGGGVYRLGNVPVTDIKNNRASKPNNFRLYNYPNPFNPVTKIGYTIPHSSNVTLTIFDVLGKKITTLVNEEKPAGNYEFHWNADNYSSGIYLYRLTSGKFSITKKMLLLK